jgi:hypothetical protein
MFKLLFQKWEVLAYLAGLLFTIGINYEMLVQNNKDVALLRAAQDELSVRQHSQDLSIQKDGLDIATLSLQVKTDEARSQTDHDILIGMAKDVTNISKWVDRQQK